MDYNEPPMKGTFMLMLSPRELVEQKAILNEMKSLVDQDTLNRLSTSEYLTYRERFNKLAVKHGMPFYIEHQIELSQKAMKTQKNITTIVKRLLKIW